jgi:hypothetical protein
MNLNLEQIVEYESIMPHCLQNMAEAIPGTSVIIRNDLFWIGSTSYPDPGVNRAYCLRTTPEKADELIEEIVEHFKGMGMPASVMISPACTPTDLPQRLLKRDFVKQEPPESWMILDNVQNKIVPPSDPKILVRQVEPDEVEAFASVSAASYEMSEEWIAPMAQVLLPTIGLPNIRHYLTYIGSKPVAAITFMRYQKYAVLGGAGVLPEFRGKNIIYNMTVNAIKQAKQDGVDTLVLQTLLGPVFERFLRICGFQFAFQRTTYILE